MYKAIDIYLEKKKTRQYVGRLQKEKGKFVFQYDESYLYIDNPIPMGPDLPLHQQKYISLKLFPSFVDRIPLKKNPAYKEYCRSVGISPSETNFLVLLATLGRKGPSSFICVPVIEGQVFSSEQLKQFRKDLKLSIREFSDLFDVSSATIYRIENSKTSGKDTLKRIQIYFQSPQTALNKIKITGVRINENKRNFVEDFFRSKLKEKSVKGKLFTDTKRKREPMKKEYNFLKMKEIKSPFKEKKGIGISLSHEVIDYFKYLSKETSVPYQQLINLYLLDYVKKQKKSI